jgi:hypothetical protein
MKYDHDKFVKDWSSIASEQEKMLALKDYMFGLPNDEFDRFLFWRLDETVDTIDKNIEAGKLTAEEKKHFIDSLDGLLEKANALQVSSRKAA